MEKSELPLEDLHLEYKKASRNRIPKNMWETVSAFANTDGGTIVLGADENTSTRELDITGIDDPSELITNLLNAQKSNNQITPQAIFEKNISIKKIDQKNLVYIYVPKNTSNRPVYLLGDMFNKTHIREKDSDRYANKDEIMLMLRDSANAIDSDLLDNIGIQDLNLNDIAKFKALIAETSKDSSIADMDTMEFLQSVGLAGKDYGSSDRTVKLNKAALLLLGKNEAITYFFPHFFLDFVTYKDTTSSDYTDRKYTSNDLIDPDNIFSFFNFVWDKFTYLITNKFNLENELIRKDQSTSILIALREALVNTLVHADYLSSEQIKISVFPEFIEFTNPGEMRVSTSDFIRGGTSIARNPKLFNTFLKAKLGEHTGSGGKRIFSITRNLELKHPDISTNVEETNIKIWSIPDMESFINTLKPEWRPAYSLFKKQLIISFGDVKDLYSTEYQARKALTEMVDAGFISKEGNGKGTKYLVSPNSPIARKMTNKMLSDINDVLVHTQID